MAKIKLSKQTIFTLLGLLVIIASIPMAVILVKQRQEIRKEARECCGECLSMGKLKECRTYDPSCCTPAPAPAPAPSGNSCGGAGGNCCATTFGGCPSGCALVGNTYDCTPCCKCPADWVNCAAPASAPAPAKCSDCSATCGNFTEAGCGLGGCGPCEMYKTRSCPQCPNCETAKCDPQRLTCCPGGAPSSGDGGASTGGTGGSASAPAWGLWLTRVDCQAPTPTVTVTPTPTPTTTTTPTPTPTTPVSCNETCSTDSQCNNNLICSSGRCRNRDCIDETDCSCPGPTPTPTATSTPGPTTTPATVVQATPTPVVELPQAGFALPTFGAIIGGLLLIAISLIFIL